MVVLIMIEVVEYCLRGNQTANDGADLVAYTLASMLQAI